MNKIEFLEQITSYAKDYAKIAKDTAVLNRHMNELSESTELDQTHIDAILVDFINFIGMKSCIDYGLYTSDLKEQNHDTAE